MDDIKDLELPKTSKHRHSILIVDDEDSILNAFKRILADGDYEVHTASNGLEGLNKLHTAQRAYSLIISVPRKLPCRCGQSLRLLR